MSVYQVLVTRRTRQLQCETRWTVDGLEVDCVDTAGVTVKARTIGEAWLAIARHIVESGHRSTYEGLGIREVLLVTLRVEQPNSSDPTIDQLADPERLVWMHANFSDHAMVAELGDSDSYATRIYDYAHNGRDQLSWVVERLRADPRCRSATITTLQPLTDTTYIPCVSLLDFYLHGGALWQVATCHSIDFGAKGYGNLVELAHISQQIADALSAPVGPLVMSVKSAHIYDTDAAYVHRILSRPL
jgi:thymidylate synthase